MGHFSIEKYEIDKLKVKLKKNVLKISQRVSYKAKTRDLFNLFKSNEIVLYSLFEFKSSAKISRLLRASAKIA